MYDYLIFEKSPPYMALLDSYTFINIWEILQNLFQNWDLKCIFNVLKIFLPLNSALKSPYMIISSCTIIWIRKLVPPAGLFHTVRLFDSKEYLKKSLKGNQLGRPFFKIERNLFVWLLEVFRLAQIFWDDSDIKFAHSALFTLSEFKISFT